MKNEVVWFAASGFCRFSFWFRSFLPFVVDTITFFHLQRLSFRRFDKFSVRSTSRVRRRSLRCGRSCLGDEAHRELDWFVLNESSV